MIRASSMFAALGEFMFARASAAPGAVAVRLLERAARWYRAADEPEHAHDWLEGLRVTPRPTAEAEIEGIARQVECVGTARTSVGILRLTLRGELLRRPDGWLGEAIAAARHVEITVEGSMGGCANVARRLLLSLAGKSCSCHVKGVAGSASALISILCPGRRTMAPDSMLCLHAPTVTTIGSPAQLRQTADRLEIETADWISRLSRRTTRPESEVKAWLGPQDIWFTPAEALQRGLVDEITSE